MRKPFRLCGWLAVAALLLLAYGCNGGDDNEINVQPISADLTVAPSDTGTTATLFQFDVEGFDENGQVLPQFVTRWDFNGDGTYDTQFDTPFYTESAQYQYETPGTYHPRVQIRDPLGNTATDTLAVTVNLDINPVFVNVTATPGEAPVNTEILLSASCMTDGDQRVAEGQVRWDTNGDGLFDTEFMNFLIDAPSGNIPPTLLVMYDNPGVYRVHAQMRTLAGRVGTGETTLTITSP